MRHSQFGRTMLETMMVIGIIGVLSVTGIYLYKKAMDNVRADAIVKDVLARASQTKGNADLNRSGSSGVKKDAGGNIISVKKRVYTPEYGAEHVDASRKLKGRYGYEYKVIDACTNKLDTSCPKSYIKKIGESEYVVIQLTNGVASDVCKAIKGKLTTYGDRYPKVVCMYQGEALIDNSVNTCKDGKANRGVNIIGTSAGHADCSNNIPSLFFTIEYR